MLSSVVEAVLSLCWHQGRAQSASDLCALMLDKAVSAAGPFSHRTMLTFEEKGIPYNKLLIDELNMPEWCAQQ
jgi:hypothetical protein